MRPGIGDLMTFSPPPCRAFLRRLPRREAARSLYART